MERGTGSAVGRHVSRSQKVYGGGLHATEDGGGDALWGGFDGHLKA